MSEAVLVEDLVKRFGGQVAIDGIGFSIGEGEFFTLLGPSGCGKTTTLRCVAGLESAEAGRIAIGGQTVFEARRGIDRPANERAIGMVFQSYAVWPHMSVAENIGYPLRVRGRPAAEIAARVEAVLAQLDMRGLGQRMPAQLSGGQQQRVALGRALALEPRVLLLDEPLSNLDAKLREQMRAELKLLQRRAGLPILYVTHDQTEALAMSDRIAVMAAGRIHHLGPPDAIYERPRTRFVLDFIGAVNYLPCRLAGEEGDLLLVDLPGGRMAVPRPGTLPRAGRLALAIRPEDLLLDAQGGPEAVVTLRAFMGDGYEYHLRLGDIGLRARSPKTVTVAEGATVRLGARHGLLVAADADPDAPVFAA
jgi:ABC-type Fe3+/spermidine/putrescine transport system ATPase subunit